MTQQRKVSIQELLTTLSYEISAVVDLLIEKGVLTQEEVISTMKKLRKMDAEAEHKCDGTCEHTE